MSIIHEEKLEELKELSGGNMDLIIDLLDKFITNADQNLDKANSAFQNGNLTEIQFAVHTMKGSALSLGLTKIGALLTTMNKYCKDGELNSFEKDAASLRGFLDEVKVYRKSLTA